MNYSEYLALQRTLELADELGFEIHPEKYEPSVMALRPKGERYPQYIREHEPWAGDSTHIRIFLEGIRWAKTYYENIHLVSDKKIERKEQDVRNRQLAERLKKTT